MSLKISAPQTAIAWLAAFVVMTTLFVCLVLHAQTATSTHSQTASTPPVPLPEGPGKTIMEHSCIGCHSLSVVTTARVSAVQWDAEVRMMVSRGAVVRDQDMQTLTQYLAKSFGPNAPTYALSAETSSTAVTPSQSDDTAVPMQPPSKIHVNVNHAGVRELCSTLSLTRDEAHTLIAYRKQHGDFTNWQQVGEIPGVPARKIIEYQNRITF